MANDEPNSPQSSHHYASFKSAIGVLAPWLRGLLIALAILIGVAIAIYIVPIILGGLLGLWLVAASAILLVFTIFFVVGSILSILPTLALGIASYRKSIVTIRRRNSIVIFVIFLFAADLYLANITTALLPFGIDIKTDVFWALLSMFIAMQLSGYILLLYEDGLRVQVEKKMSLWDRLKIIPTVVIFLFRDLIAPSLLAAAFLWKYGAGVPMVAEAVSLSILKQFREMAAYFGIMGDFDYWLGRLVDLPTQVSDVVRTAWRLVVNKFRPSALGSSIVD